MEKPAIQLSPPFTPRPIISEVTAAAGAPDTLDIHGSGFGEQPGLVRLLILERHDTPPELAVLGWTAQQVRVRTNGGQLRGLLLLETALGQVSNAIALGQPSAKARTD